MNSLCCGQRRTINNNNNRQQRSKQTMYATVRRYDGVTDVHEVTRRVNEGFVQIVRELPGFAAYYCIDAGGGVLISVSVYQDRASAEESNARASNFVGENLAAVLPNRPQITAGEVVAHTAR